MRINNLFAVAVAAGMTGWAGCTTPTGVKSGPIKAATFNFLQDLSSKKSDFADNKKVVHEIIQKAITDHLAEKGVARAAGDVDVKVAYLLIVGNNVSTMAINDFFGYGRDDAQLAEKAHKAYAVDNKNPDYFEAGTLVIDVLDARSFKLLMRNHVTKPILRDAPVAVREARIREAVDETLKNLKFAK